MRKFNKNMWFMALLLVVFLAGCGGGGGGGGGGLLPDPDDNTAPTVISTAPAADAIDVPINRKIIATFDEPMRPSTITDTGTFTLTLTGIGAVAGEVKYNIASHILIFEPTVNLAAGVYTATITTAAEDVSGNALAGIYEWSFTVGTDTDITLPTVSYTMPADDATDVPSNMNIIATFSEVMDPDTIDITTFTLEESITDIPVLGFVSYAGSTATFNPTLDLVPGLEYDAKITTTAKDLAGNALAIDYEWSFTAGDGNAEGQLPVNLGLAGDYAIFALTGIDSASSAAIITGNIGVGPGVTSSAITGFDLILPAGSAFSTSTQVVNGNVYAFDYADPTGDNVTTASTDMGLAYTNAAGRTADVTELGGGTLTGLTLVPGVYKWTGNVVIPTDLSLSGGANEVWIFQISGNLDMAAAKSVLLSGGAVPENIFWQVGGIVTLGAGTHFEGIVLSQTAINFGSGASANGRLLAQTAVNLVGASEVTQP